VASAVAVRRLRALRSPSYRSVLRAIERRLDAWVDAEVASIVDRLDLDMNALGYDGWGVSRRATQRTLAAVRWLYRSSFRVQTVGMEHVPDGRVLLIGNHSGQLPLDGVIVGASLALDRDPPRFAHAMIERFFAGVPFVNVFMARVGQQIGLPQHCERLLTHEEAAVLVFPEGIRGSGKVVWDRYRLMGFGSGFMRLAMQTRTPIVPFGFVGGEEMAFSFSRMKPLARVLGLPYLPLSPTLGLPLPVRCHLTFGAPLFFDGDWSERDEVVRANVDVVEAAITELLREGRQRRHAHP